MKWWLQDQAGDGTGGAAGGTGGENKEPAGGENNDPGEGSNVQGKWPEQWRVEFAGGDDKALKQLERYASPQEVWKKARALEQKVSSGELKPNVPFPDKGTPEQQISWRKEQGLPEAPEKYELKLPEGFVVGEADKPLVDDFLKEAYGANMPPSAVNKAVNWFFQNKEKQMAAEKEAVAKIEKDTEDALRGEWGNDYRKYESVIDGLLAETLADEKLRADLKLASKRNLDFAKWMLGTALQLNPSGTILPGTSGNQVQAISDELASIANMQSNNPTKYWTKDVQDRERELIAARDKLQKK